MIESRAVVELKVKRNSLVVKILSRSFYAYLDRES